MPSKQLVVFDFDCSIPDNDTDRYVLEVLDPKLRLRMEELKDKMQWTDLVADTMVELHKRGGTKEDVISALQVLPVHPAMKRGVRNLKARKDIDTTFLCLSNSNQVYINTILQHHGLTDIFSDIITNPAAFTSDGMLEVKRRVLASDTKQHQCTVGCSANMCKGEELEAYIEQHGGRSAFDRIVYVGDGSNDFCPLLRLKSTDLALVRFDFALARRIAKQGESAGMTVPVKYWDGAWEVELAFEALV
ncbi:hypothetical protein P389DRAFT_48499 [Cystobasidium minutum MCA 4210]|uniref:uncharacterized protein n=1 Tax=Cystobasidium minutum MCA 4210 TaxID=1397322 RepID=UPI0034CD3425|eukprot:jgi/Rhomi1/48499/CE48498_1755